MQEQEDEEKRSALSECGMQVQEVGMFQKILRVLPKREEVWSDMPMLQLLQRGMIGQLGRLNMEWRSFQYVCTNCAGSHLHLIHLIIISRCPEDVHPSESP